MLFGSDVANAQPVVMKYLYLARREGTKVAVVNPYREPGLERYWVPSNAESALFGTKMADEFFQVRIGGDIAFIAGVLKALARGRRARPGFIADHTTGWDELSEALDVARAGTSSSGCPGRAAPTWSASRPCTRPPTRRSSSGRWG